MDRRERWAWAGGLLLALATRVGASLERAGLATLTGMVDSRIYRQLAEQLPQQGWLPAEGFYMSPLYPYLLALAPGDGVLATLLWQSLLGVAGVAALALAARAKGGALAGAATLWLGALAGPLVVYDSALLADGPAFALLAIALAALTVRPAIATRGLLGVGVALALAYALRANLLLPLVLLCGWQLLEHRGRLPRGLRRALVLAAPTLLVMLGLAAMNQRAEGHFTPRSFNAGQNLYIGNNAFAEGTYTTLNEITPSDMMGRGFAQRAAGRELDAAEVEGFWRERALEWLGQNPGDALALVGRKLLLFLHPYELPQMEALVLARRESVALSLARVGMGAVLALAVVGVVGWWSRRDELWPLRLNALAALVICLVFFVNGRLRLPLWASLLPMAGLGVAWLRAGWIARDRRPLLALGGGVAALLLLLIYPVHADYRHALSAHRYAVLEAMAGERERAREWVAVGREIGQRPSLQGTYQEHPDTRWYLQMEEATAWYVLGDLQRAFREMVPVADALPSYQRAQEGVVEIGQRLVRQGLGGEDARAAVGRAQARLARLQGGGPRR